MCFVLLCGRRHAMPVTAGSISCVLDLAHRHTRIYQKTQFQRNTFYRSLCRKQQRDKFVESIATFVNYMIGICVLMISFSFLFFSCRILFHRHLHHLPSQLPWQLQRQFRQVPEAHHRVRPHRAHRHQIAVAIRVAHCTQIQRPAKRFARANTNKC